MFDSKQYPHYIDKIHPNSDYHHGQILPAKGVKNVQVARANRTAIDGDDGSHTTYKHAADLAYFKGHFYVHYLVNPSDEHTEPGFSILARSKNGRDWNEFQVSFPVYTMPTCSIKDYKGDTHHLGPHIDVYMHQRMSFYQSPSSKRMLVSGFYGWSPEPWMTNWDRYGIGRVVRELCEDGSLGPIYFIRPNWQAGWSEEQLNYPLYTKSDDESFVELCDELLGNKLYTQQWAEETGDLDDLIQIKHPEQGTYQAFTWYSLNQDNIIGLWKHALVSRSNDGGKSWSTPERSPSLVMSGAKVWAEQTKDKRFAMVYNPTLETQHRYPLCVTTSRDGLAFSKMRLVHGEVPDMRFKGFWKDMGPQYIRGISEGNDLSSDPNMWLTYSVNKEDIWIASVPTPIEDETNTLIDECFTDTKVLDHWNVYSPKWAPVRLEMADERQVLRLRDFDPYDYARVMRMLKPGSKKEIELTVNLHQVENTNLQIELLDEKGIVAIRLVFRPDGKLYVRTVTEIELMPYEAHTVYTIGLRFDCEDLRYTLSINGKDVLDEEGLAKKHLFMAAVNEVAYLSIRTGDQRQAKSLDYDPEGKPEVPLIGADIRAEEAIYDIHRFYAKDI